VLQLIINCCGLPACLPACYMSLTFIFILNFSTLSLMTEPAPGEISLLADG
jgi:hypothetical protein